MSVSPALLSQFVAEVGPYSDMRAEQLMFVGQQLIMAHEAAPGRISIEVGTRKGGSALLLLQVLMRLYRPPFPLLVSVDPYGGKPYHGGDAIVPMLYGDDTYTEMRQRLASWPFHVHFKLTSLVFARQLLGQEIWSQGRSQLLTDLAFVLLDGEHDLETVRAELSYFKPVMAKGGRIVIDNIDKDPNLLDYCDRTSDIGLGPEAPAGARQGLWIRR